MTLEISLETRGRVYLCEQGAFPVKRGYGGEPDTEVLWGGGRHFWIEWKKEKTGRVRPGQKTYHNYLRAIGDEVHIIDTFEQLVEVVMRVKIHWGPATASRDKAFNG